MMTLTVYFDGQFWVGVFERNDENGYAVAKIIFGAEPHDDELFNLIVRDYYKVHYSASLPEKPEKIKTLNPKRMQREIRRKTASQGIGTKAQLAIKAEQERRLEDRKMKRKHNREEKEQIRFELKQIKKKEKKKGH